MNNWFAITNPENYEILKGVGFSFYAVGEASRRSVERMKVGDKVVLYRSGKNSGIVGTFEISGHAEQNGDATPSFPFPYRIAWRTILTIDEPLSIRPIVPILDFIVNKTNYGTALQGSLRTISGADYHALLDLLKRNKSKADAGP